MTDHGRIRELAGLGAGLINAQLDLASTTSRDALRDLWALGYCFAVFDALGQRAKLDQHPDSLLLLMSGFQRLLSDRHAAASKLGFAIDKQKDALFQQGSAQGGSEVWAWLSDKNKVPAGLALRLNTNGDGKPN